MKIKICGLTREEDILFACTQGVDAVGIVNIPTSKRYVTLKKAEKLFGTVPPFTSKVIVAAPKNLREAEKIQDIGVNYIQLHGKQETGYIKQLREHLSIGLIKQIPVKGPETITLCKQYSKYVDAILLDTETKTGVGGTGKTHDWNISAEITREIKKPVILAGGLNPENIRDAINKVKPYAVDVASGVEEKPGIKNKKKIEEFIRKVREI